MTSTQAQGAHNAPEHTWAVGLEDVLGVPPAPAALFMEAFTHASYANEQPEPRPAHNQRLEFLGDAVIGLAVAQHLWRRFPERPEGELARARAALVNTQSLAAVGRALDLGRWLRIGKGEAKAGGRERDSTLCDLFEAVVGAIFLAYGWETADTFVLDRLHAELEQIAAAPTPGVDAKTRLQELLHQVAPASPEYTVAAMDGPPHARIFTVAVLWEGRHIGAGQGRSKRAAEQAAAEAALQTLEHDMDSLITTS